MSTKLELVVTRDPASIPLPNAPSRIDLAVHVNKENAVLLGREERCTLMFPSERVSRQHCLIWREKDKVFVRDLKSLNKSYLNGVALSPEKDYQVLPGQIVSMGGPTGPSKVKLEASEAMLTVVPSLAGVGFEDDEPGGAFDATLKLKDFTADDKSVLQSRLKCIYEASHAMTEAQTLGDIVEICLDQLMAAFPDTCNALMVLYSRTGELPTVIKRNARQVVNYTPEGLACARFRSDVSWDTRELKLSRTILNRVKNEKIAFWINAKDLKTLTAFKSAIGVESFTKVNALMASPMISGDKNLGMIQLFSTGTFNDEDVNILRLLSALTGLIVRNIELAFTALEEQTRRSNLQRFFAPSIAEGLLNGTLQAKLGGELRNGTIFYSDICGFTRLSADMRPEDVVGLLNRYFTVMQQLVFRRGGSVDKCAGDQIMAFWGVLGDLPEFSAHAVAAGLEMQIAVFEFNRDEPGRSGFTLPPGGLAHGIGLNTGKVCAGNIGGAQKIEFTVIGDVVNVANRIESAAGRGQVFVSESTWSAIQHRSFGFNLPPVSMRNVRLCPKLIAIRGIVPPGVPGAVFSIDDMLLNLPCEIHCGSAAPVEALVTGFKRKDKNRGAFVMQVKTPLTPDAECSIEWRIPETKQFSALKGRVLRSEILPKFNGDESAVPLASDARCGLAHEEPRLAPGTAVIHVDELSPEWLTLTPNSLRDSDYKSEHEIIR
ncbi:MAG: adenylate/guanylate cyclase domain-containing protein [Planctomycetota bacterium]